MTWFITFISAGILLGLSVIQLVRLREKKKKNQRDEVWDKQLDDLLQSFKKKPE